MGMRLIERLLSVVALLALASGHAQAEFLTLGSKSYVNEEGTLGMVLVDRGPKQGIFILSNPSAQQAQTFSPLINSPDAQSFFVEFDDQGRRAERLTTAQGKTYSLTGAFRFKFSSIESFAIEKNSWGTYVTLTSGNAILALSGLVPIVNAGTEEAVGILEANKPTIGKESASFSFDTKGDILLGGKRYSGDNMGLGRDYEHACLQLGVAIVSQAALKALPLEEPARKQKLEQLVRKSKRLADYILLFVTDASVVLYDAVTNSFGLLTSSAEPSVCSLTAVDIKKR